jgi:hypothetical protein
MDRKPKIFRIFSNDHHLDKDLSNYNVVFPKIENYLKKLWLAYISFPIDDFTDEEFENLNQEIIKTAKENPDIEGVYMGYDIEAFLISAVFKNLDLPSLKLPNLESFYQVHHKVYQKMLEQDPTKYSYFDLFADDWDQHLPKFPFYMKSALGDGGLHNYIIRDRNQLDGVIEVLRKELPKQESTYLYFAKKYLDLSNFPLASKHIMLCEELIVNFTNLNMDAVVDDQGNITILLFSDQLIKKETVIGYRFPSQISEDVTERAKQMGLEVIQKSGLRNASFNIEYFILENGDIKIMEVNARSSLYFNFNYHIYGIRYLDIAVRLSMGEKINLPILKFPLKFSTQLHILTKKSGKLKDILNFEKCREIANANPDYVINFEDKEMNGESIIEDNYHKNGQLLLQIFFASSSIEECEKEILRLQSLLLLQDDYFK